MWPCIIFLHTFKLKFKNLIAKSQKTQKKLTNSPYRFLVSVDQKRSDINTRALLRQDIIPQFHVTLIVIFHSAK